MSSIPKAHDEDLHLPHVTWYDAPELGTVAKVAESQDGLVCELTLIWGPEEGEIDRTLSRSPGSAHRVALGHAMDFGGPVASDPMMFVWGS
jgi:hypothetical protein